MGLPLFAKGSFRSRAGLLLPFKIECDALTPADWDAIAAVVAARLGPFGNAVPVPNGGVPFALALEQYRRPGERRILICDDVLTTGGSMGVLRDFSLAAGIPPELVSGIVLFARRPCPPWVHAVFGVAGWVDGWSLPALATPAPAEGACGAG